MSPAAVEEHQTPRPVKAQGSKHCVPSPSELPFAPQGPISASVSSLPALALQGRCCPSPMEEQSPWAGHGGWHSVLPPHLIPSCHPPSPRTFGQEQGAKLPGCVRGAPNPHPNSARSSLARVWSCLLALPDRFQSSCSFQESSPFLLLQLSQELDYQALGMPQIFACLKQQRLWVQP